MTTPNEAPAPADGPGTSPAQTAGPSEPGVFDDPGVRGYVFAGLAALALVFVVMLQRGSDVGGLALALLGGAGIALRWPAAPGFFLVVLLYFVIFPFGVPTAYENKFELAEGRFRVADLLLAGAVVVYLACHYRVLGLTAHAVTPEEPPARGGAKPVRRPAALIRPGELTRLLYLAAAAVVAGQLVWLGVSSLEIDVLAPVPLRLVKGPPEVQTFKDQGLSSPATWSVLVIGLVFFAALTGRVVFGYWRLRSMTPDEARMLLQDEAWNETRREQSRVAGWRARHRRKAESSRAEGGK